MDFHGHKGHQKVVVLPARYLNAMVHQENMIVCLLRGQVRGKWEALVAGKLKDENKKCEITPPDER
jgi:hypothetical protein